MLYLRKGAWSLPDHPDHPHWDANHRRHGHEPANTITPVRVSVDVVVLQRFVLNQKEKKYCLKGKKRHKKKNENGFEEIIHTIAQSVLKKC